MSRSSPARPQAQRALAAGRGKPHTIRIIGGDWKRTPLPVLDLNGLRPTPDRVRETIFNWLGQNLEGRRCLDLFAGSGALGFEAASRGAASVVMVERHPRAAQQLRALKDKLAARAVEVAEADALRIAAGLAPRSFDVVFVDPPFGDAAAFARALELVPELVAPGGFLYVETGALLDPSAHASLAGWQVTRRGKAGAVHYHLLQRENDE